MTTLSIPLIDDELLIRGPRRVLDQVRQFVRSFSPSLFPDETGGDPFYVKIKDNECGLVQGDDLLFKRSFPDEFLLTFERFLIRQFLSRLPGRTLLLHSGGIRIGNSICLLVGGPGEGKTTAVAQLLTSESAFLSDEMVAIHPTRGQLIPFPRSLSPVSSPEISNERAQLLIDQLGQRFHYLDPPRGDVDVRPLEIDGAINIEVVILNRGETGQLETLNHGEGLVELIPHILEPTSSSKRFSLLAELSDLNLNFHRLSYREIDHWTDSIRSLLIDSGKTPLRSIPK